eukprot:NODE_6932_length_1624_cov_8.150301.p1 GENE.NODE_6932_length_1624_cov_8.150301~~NODE_6932_length_1624_cov_8.150301.p1  ORF type:complete len:456 (+),score=145.25 NODE_6932_length_1624_cov_8.150301:100-1368(+)
MAVGCCLDSLVWSELGSRWPESGGSYVYLSRLYGEKTWGRFAAFIYVWQFLVTAPMEIASGNIAIAQYLAYVDGTTSYWHNSCVACALCALTVALLYQGVAEVGRITLVLWVATLAAILFTWVVGFSHFHPDHFTFPAGAFEAPTSFVWSIGIAMRFGIYDFTGYYDVCQMGGEVENPRRTIPVACIGTCICVAVIYGLTYLAVVGYLPWSGPDGFVSLVKGGSDEANFIMALFCEKLFGRDVAIAFVFVVCACIFGANFAFTCGCAYIPCAAADGGHFFRWLGHRHATRDGLADYSLLCVGFVACVFCFVQLEWIIQAMMTLLVLIQFIGQSVGLMMLRVTERAAPPLAGSEAATAWKAPLFPVVFALQLLIFGFAFVTSARQDLALAGLFLVVGTAAFAVWAHHHHYWPFEVAFSAVPGD